MVTSVHPPPPQKTKNEHVRGGDPFAIHISKLDPLVHSIVAVHIFIFCRLYFQVSQCTLSMFAVHGAMLVRFRFSMFAIQVSISAAHIFDVCRSCFQLSSLRRLYLRQFSQLIVPISDEAIRASLRFIISMHPLTIHNFWQSVC